MKKVALQIAGLFVILFLAIGVLSPVANAAEITDEEVQNVITQLEAIDTLQEMQDNRKNYVASGSYDVQTTNQKYIDSHEAKRAEYETYIATMFAARTAAQNAYDALTEAQKALIDPELVAKLDNTLETVFRDVTATVTPRTDEYHFEVINGEFGSLPYEIGNHVTVPVGEIVRKIPTIFVIVDTLNGKTEWTSDGPYEAGKSNYNLAYCCDLETMVEEGFSYKRVNLEDSQYYSDAQARKIRAIVQNSYPFVSVDEMKAILKADGMNPEFVDSLTRGDIISAVQLSVWIYSNSHVETIFENMRYNATFDVPTQIGTYYGTPMHDYSNELWSYWTVAKKQRTYDARAEYRVNTLVHYLCNLEGAYPENDQMVINDIKIARADLLAEAEDLYRLGLRVFLNHGGDADDDINITVTSYHENADGTTSKTAQIKQLVNGRDEIELSIKAKSGDKVKVVVEGTQKVSKGVYVYESEGGYTESQSLVGVSGGTTKVRSEEEFEFEEKIKEHGLRIYKADNKTGRPIPGIDFTIYKVVPGEGEKLELDKTPSKEALDKYKTEANKLVTLTTDKTGYASTILDEGYYLIIEEENPKVVKPVDPFYIKVPMQQEKVNDDGSTTIETVKVVSIYPKNEPYEPPIVPPPPPPSNVVGQLEVLKYEEGDTNTVLEGATFELYLPATENDSADDIKTILVDGVELAVVPVYVNGEKVVMTTGKDGKAVSPELPCNTYFLVETKAPSGYSLLEEAVPVTVISKEIVRVTTVEVANQRGNILPETGGIGTTWFTVCGCILVTTAVVFACKKRYF